MYYVISSLQHTKGIVISLSLSHRWEHGCSERLSKLLEFTQQETQMKITANGWPEKGGGSFQTHRMNMPLEDASTDKWRVYFSCVTPGWPDPGCVFQSPDSGFSPQSGQGRTALSQCSGPPQLSCSQSASECPRGDLFLS